MFNHLVKENHLEEEFEKYNLSERDRTFITEQIQGPSQHMKKKVSIDFPVKQSIVYIQI